MLGLRAQAGAPSYMSIEDLRDAITSLAAQINSPLILEDDRQRLVAYSPHHTIPDEARREAIMARSLRPEVIAWCEQWDIRTSEQPVRTPRDDTIEIGPRLCVPLRYNGTLLGFIWAIDEPALGDEAIDAIEDAATGISLQMHRDQVAVKIGSEFLRGLVSDSAELREMCAADVVVKTALPSGMRAVVMVVRGDPVDDIDALLHRRDSRALRFTVGNEIVVLSPESAGGKTARKLAVAILSESPEEWQVAIGLSNSHASTSLHLAYHQASNAVLVAATIPSEGRIARWGNLGAYRLLTRAATSIDADAIDEPRLARIIDDPKLLKTVETYLDLASSAKATAEALHIHRATLYYRLEKIEQLTGADLGTGADRLAFHVGVKLLRLRGHISSGTDPADEI